MIQEDKDLLLQDLCARLPYGIFVKFRQYTEPLLISIKDALAVSNGGEMLDDIQYLYLRPMSSMTEEEREEANKLWDIITKTRNDLHYLYTDFLLSHHLDYRGLIPMGLALEAPEGMYTIHKITCDNCENNQYCSQSECVKKNCYKL